MEDKMIFSGFIGKDRIEKKFIEIKNKLNKPVFFHYYIPDTSFNNLNLKDMNETLKVSWDLKNSSFQIFLKSFLSSYSTQNIFWNINKENIQKVGIKDLEILEKLNEEGTFSVFVAEQDALFLFQQNLSSKKSKIITYFFNYHHSYIDLINYFQKDQRSKGFEVVPNKKEIISMKLGRNFDLGQFKNNLEYYINQTLPDAPIETLHSNFCVIGAQKTSNKILDSFSPWIAYDNNYNSDFEFKTYRIYRTETLETEDFVLCVINIIFESEKRYDIFSENIFKIKE
ncbi:MAG TPA: hypothetical protein HA283_03990 [Nanoarchaeota archaeon]|nr:hypothetical protein [Nanoarchaeota archaeon]HIH63431.1 hypothetical protein [Nanoarchaeota archaeon]HIJ09361.1 hypothetical protein [Nanoarchaeota archaeon]